MNCNCFLIFVPLQKIDGLKQLTKLEKLYFYSNNISKIENIEHLTKLHTLWLNDNRISDIEVGTNDRSFASSRFDSENMKFKFA